jgi:hypothetical protein
LPGQFQPLVFLMVRQEAPHLKLQAQVADAPLFQRQQLRVGNEVLQRRHPDLALGVKGTEAFVDASGTRGPLPSGAYSVVSTHSSRPAPAPTSGMPICSWTWK